MGKDASTITSPSPRQLRDACAATRARITAQVDEVEARLRTRIRTVVGTTAQDTGPARMGSLELLQAMNRVTGPAMTAMLLGAAIGYGAMRRFGPGRD